MMNGSYAVPFWPLSPHIRWIRDFGSWWLGYPTDI
jgi:hypothetical protein